jgi:hypothetical protein
MRRLVLILARQPECRFENQPAGAEQRTRRQLCVCPRESCDSALRSVPSRREISLRTQTEISGLASALDERRRAWCGFGFADKPSWRERDAEGWDVARRSARPSTKSFLLILMDGHRKWARFDAAFGVADAFNRLLRLLPRGRGARWRRRSWPHSGQTRSARGARSARRGCRDAARDPRRRNAPAR